MVPGKLENVDHVFVSVGAGYVIEKSVEEAREFFKAKSGIIEPNIKSLRNQAMSVEEQLPIVQQVSNSSKDSEVDDWSEESSVETTTSSN